MPNHSALLDWYRLNRRDLPWRSNSEAYAVWISEIMLQQTGVSTVIPYFERWMHRFPSVQELAQAHEQDVLSAWQGLGYYRRCRHLLAGARTIAANGWPKTAVAWRSIPGVGRYTAGAIASIALGEAAPLVDGNVKRVYSRLTGDSATDVLLTRRTWLWAEEELCHEAPGDWNQALMELGATVCTPAAPRCGICPLGDVCHAKQTGRTGELPTPTPKRKVISLAFRVDIAFCEDSFGLRQIPDGEWWAAMWEFPRSAYESGDRLEEGETALPLLRHVVTHHRITLHPVLRLVSDPRPDLRWLTSRDLENIPMPAPHRRLLDSALSYLAARS